MDVQPPPSRGPHRKFGRLLRLGIAIVAKTLDQPINIVERMMAERTHFGSDTIRRFERGFLPQQTVIKDMARFFYECRGRYFNIYLFLEDFLQAADFDDRERLLASLLPNETPTLYPIEPILYPDRLPRHNLRNPDFLRLVGRERELEAVTEFLSMAHRAWVMSICGKGGVGKSALALALAHRILEGQMQNQIPLQDDFKAIVWVTAKHEELLPQGMVRQVPTFTTLDELYSVLVMVLEVTPLIPLLTPQTRVVWMRQVLSEYRTLLILDNFDTATDEALLLFLRDLPHPSKAIVTTRHHIDVALPLSLETLSETEARCLLDDQLRLLAVKGRDVLPDAQQRAEFVRITHGLPLAIVFGVGRCMWLRGSGDLRLSLSVESTRLLQDFIFEPTLKLIRGRIEHTFLLVLTLFPAGTTLATLNFITIPNASDSGVDALRQLEILGLVKRSQHAIFMDTLTRTVLLAEATKYSEVVSSFYQRWTQWVFLLAEDLQTVSNFQRLHTEISNLMTWLDWQKQTQQISQIATFYRLYHYFLYAEGEWKLLSDLSTLLIPYAEDEGDDALLLLVLNMMLLGCRDQRNHETFKDFFHRLQALRLKSSEQPLGQVAHYYWLRHMDYYEQVTGQAPLTPEQIVIEMDRLLPALLETGEVDKVVEALNTIGNRYLKQTDYRKAHERYTNALQILQQSQSAVREPERWLAAIHGNLALVLGRQGFYQEAIDKLEMCLPDLYEQSDLTEAYTVLAWYYAQIGEMREARRWRKKAIAFIERLVLKADFCQENLAWLQQFG